MEALSFAERHVTISKDDIETIRHARKSLLFDSSQTWIKRDGGLFDVTMGAYDGAEVCELVGTYMLSLISNVYKKSDVGLYRDDGLAVFKNTSGPQNERIKKKIQKIFKDKGLDIVIECNKKVVDYLDAFFNLEDGSYRPFRKPDDETVYINVHSDHPHQSLSNCRFLSRDDCLQSHRRKRYSINRKVTIKTHYEREGILTNLSSIPQRREEEETDPVK